MTQASFVKRRAPDWERLETAVATTASGGLARLGEVGAIELGTLYRRCTADLAFASSRGYDPQLVAQLNRLIARAHALVYATQAQPGFARVGQFLATAFPAEFRRSAPYIILCSLLTIICGVVGNLIVSAHPNDAYALLPSAMIPAHIVKSLHNSNFAFGPDQSPAFSAMIITNNVKVAIIAFAGSVTLGAMTLWIIAFNGLMLGVLASRFTAAGFGLSFWATIAPHGVIELTAIQIAGAAGLLIAAGLLAPGPYSRREAIRRNAARAAVLFGGVVAMLVVAGTIEGFFSPLRLAPQFRLAFGVATAIALIVYFAPRDIHRSLQPRDAAPEDPEHESPGAADA